MDILLTPAEEKADRNGKIGAAIGFILFVVLLVFPIFWKMNPPPGQPGILVNLGQIDIGTGSENARASAAQPQPDPAPQPTPPPAPAPEKQPEPEPDPVPEPPAPTPQPQRPVIQQETPAQIALRQREAREEQARQDKARQDRLAAQQLQDRLNKEEADRKAREAAAAKAQKARDDAAAAAAAEANSTKDQIGGLFGNGSGNGNTGKPGNQGDPNGDPNATNLEGISTGDGRVAGGLGGRGVVASPPVRENSQVSGRVVVKVCVGPSGNIVSAESTINGSSTQDSKLVNAAVANARKWKFKADPTAPQSQCGTITYDFKVQ